METETSTKNGTATDANTVLADSKQRLQEAMEIVTASLNTMTEHTRKGWLAYIGEAIENDCGYASLIDLQSVIDERFRNEGW